MFSKIKILIVTLFMISTIVSSQTVVQWYTSKGNFKGQIREDLVPITGNNFIDLTNANFYDNLIFHRVIQGFMIQDGCPRGDGTGDPGYEIPNEIHPDLNHNSAGVLSMANAGPDTGGSQYFITVDSYPHLNGDYSVFGKIIEGLDVVYNISYVPTLSDKPIIPVTIDSIRVLYSPPAEGVYVSDYILGQKMQSSETRDINIADLFKHREDSLITVSVEDHPDPVIATCFLNYPYLTVYAGNSIAAPTTITLKGENGAYSETHEIEIEVFSSNLYNTEDYETGTLVEYPWEFPGSYEWMICDTTAQEGTYSMQSSDISGDQTAEINLEMEYGTLNDGKISFWYKVSSQEDYDYFEFWMDREKLMVASGETPWREITFDVPNGIHTFKWKYVKNISGDDGSDCAWIDNVTFEGGISTSIDNSEAIIQNSELHQNYPNPFNPSTEISFSLDRSQVVKLSVYNLSGQLVSNLVNKQMNKGIHKVNFNASELNSGIYFYMLECEGFSETNKMLLIK